MNHSTARRSFGKAKDISPGSIARLGDGCLYRVITPKILESCRSGEWVYDASLYGYDAEPVAVEFIGNQADPHVLELVRSETA